MKIVTDISGVKLNNTCITIGKFDGLHRGHQKLFDKMDILCSGIVGGSCTEERIQKVVVTFDIIPQEYLNNESRGYILSESEKRRVCADLGADVYVCIPISRHFLDMSAEAFIKDILVGQLGARYIVTGEDFRFGKDRLGGADTIRRFAGKYGYESAVVPQEEYNGEKISSSRIKEAVRAGRMNDAALMLGRRFSFFGKVEHGRQIGRGMHIPTANIVPDTAKVMPPAGVYRTIVVSEKGNEFGAISNIGVNPTVTDVQQIKLETHIFDFSGELYGQDIEVKLLEFVRPEKKFASVQELKRQIESDIAKCRLENNE